MYCFFKIKCYLCFRKPIKLYTIMKQATKRSDKMVKEIIDSGIVKLIIKED